MTAWVADNTKLSGTKKRTENDEGTTAIADGASMSSWDGRAICFELEQAAKLHELPETAWLHGPAELF